MSRPLSTRHPDPVSSYLVAIDAEIPRWLRSRRAALSELADGLDDAITDYRTQGLSPQEAATRAVSDSGPPSIIADAFTDVLSAGHARRTALALLVTGPLIGVVWLNALVPGSPPTMLLAQILPLGPVILASVVTSVLTLLVTGPARLRPAWAPRRPQRLAAFACACSVVGDLLVLGTTMITALTMPGNMAGYPLIGAVVLTLTRLAITQRVARRDLTRAPSNP
ncbi:hypothetical protein [Agromyces neolithicus]|uniref:DUF1700 domain-containing protein n=1 Tax=Agromyces neolithicus TaxID=269420 RepID=A0ABN2MAT4_9MICO